MEENKKGNENVKEISRIRKLFTANVMLKHNLTVATTTRGGFQVRRNSDVIMAATKHAFKITMPPNDALRKIALGAKPCAGNKHMSWVPYEEVTEQLVLFRCKDKRCTAAIMAEVYADDPLRLSPNRKKSQKIKAVDEDKKAIVRNAAKVAAEVKKVKINKTKVAKKTKTKTKTTAKAKAATKLAAALA